MEILGKPAVAVDTETTGLHPWGVEADNGWYPSRPFAVSWCDLEFNTGYRRFEVDPFNREVLYSKKPKTHRRLSVLLEDPDTIKVMHNSNFDMLMLHHAGFKVNGLIVDTKDLAHVATYGGEPLGGYSLKSLAYKYFDYPMDDQKDLEASVKANRKTAKTNGWCIAEDRQHFGIKPWLADYWLGDPKLCRKYAIGDVERTMLLFQFFGPIIHKNSDLRRVFERETKLYMGPVRMMEFVGMRVFPDKVDELERYYRRYMDRQDRIIKKEVPELENIRTFTNSPKQKREIFIGRRNLRPLQYTPPSKSAPSGNPKCDGEFLQFYANSDKLAEAVLERTNAEKAINGFLNQYRRRWVEESPGVIVLHPNVRQTGAITGRMSCSDPNLMNVASESTGRRRSKIAMKPRETLGPRPGCLWYLPDYSQIEVWLFAFLSENKVMMEALLTGKDFHGTVAETVWGKEKDYQKRHTYYRKCAKLIMFCTLYGGGIGKLAQLIMCSYEEAAAFRARHAEELPGLKEYLHRVSNRAQRAGYIVNAMGRHCAVPSDKPYRAVNYEIQGAAADIQKEALINIYDLIVEDWPGCNILMSMHDESLIEVPYEYHSKELMREIVECMQRAADPVGLPVKLPVGMKICTDRWYKTKEIPLEDAA